VSPNRGGDRSGRLDALNRRDSVERAARELERRDDLLERIADRMGASIVAAEA
jgi:hypothetical protein